MEFNPSFASVAIVVVDQQGDTAFIQNARQGIPRNGDRILERAVAVCRTNDRQREVFRLAVWIESCFDENRRFSGQQCEHEAVRFLSVKRRDGELDGIALPDVAEIGERLEEFVVFDIDGDDEPFV